jgi:hypothetical protein
VKEEFLAGSSPDIAWNRVGILPSLRELRISLFYR